MYKWKSAVDLKFLKIMIYLYSIFFCINAHNRVKLIMRNKSGKLCLKCVIHFPWAIKKTNHVSYRKWNRGRVNLQIPSCESCHPSDISSCTAAEYGFTSLLLWFPLWRHPTLLQEFIALGLAFLPLAVSCPSCSICFGLLMKSSLLPGNRAA